MTCWRCGDTGFFWGYDSGLGEMASIACYCQLCRQGQHEIPAGFDRCVHCGKSEGKMQEIIDQLKKLYEPQRIPGGTSTYIGETAMLAKLMAEALEKLTPRQYEFHFPDGVVIVKPVEGGLPELAKEAFRVWKEKPQATGGQVMPDIQQQIRDCLKKIQETDKSMVEGAKNLNKALEQLAQPEADTLKKNKEGLFVNSLGEPFDPQPEIPADLPIILENKGE